MVEVTNQEYNFLLFFVCHPRQILNREQILEHVWGYNTKADTHVLEVFIDHFHQKLEAQGGIRLIQTIRGYGYVLRK